MCIVDRFDILADLEGRHFDIFLSFIFGSHPLGLELLVILGGDGDVLDDGYIESGLALRVFMSFCLSELASLALLFLVVLQLCLDLLQVYLSLPLRGDYVDVEFGWVLVVEAMVEHLQLLQAAI
jgi:hypothetical protein